jgi:hypothetical protein
LSLEIAKLTPFGEDLDLERESRFPARFPSQISESISIAENKSTSRKRPQHEVENESPARNRVNIEAKSQKTAIRDASEASIKAIKQAEKSIYTSKDYPQSCSENRNEDRYRKRQL